MFSVQLLVTWLKNTIIKKTNYNGTQNLVP